MNEDLIPFIVIYVTIAVGIFLVVLAERSDSWFLLIGIPILWPILLLVLIIVSVVLTFYWSVKIMFELIIDVIKE